MREAAAQGRYLCPDARDDRRHRRATRTRARRRSRRRIATSIVAAGRRLAGELGIFLHVGSTAIVRADGKIANRALLFSPDGATLATYDKIHMFDVDLDNGESWRESARPTSRARRPSSPIRCSARLGFAICYDLRFPQLFRAEALAGAEVLIGARRLHPPDRRRRTGMCCCAPAPSRTAPSSSPPRKAAVHEDGRETFGHSLIVDPWGRILAEADHDEPGVIVAEIDTQHSADARKKIPNLKNAREFGVSLRAAGEGALKGAAS